MGKDKVQHFAGGLVIAALVAVIVDPLGGLLAAVAVGGAKEVVWDHALKKGTADVLDFMATVAGGVVGAAAVQAILVIWSQLQG